MGPAAARAPVGFATPGAQCARLYLDSPTNAVVLCVDEKTQIQALERTQPILPLRPGLPARQTNDYRRSGITSLYAALEVASGRVTGATAERHTGQDFLRFCQLVERRYRGSELHLLVDNSSTHSVPAVQEWLEAHPLVHFHFTPIGASWLNMVEAWFGILTRRSLRRGSFPTVRALVEHIKAYIDHWNEHPRRSSGPRTRPRSFAWPSLAALNKTSRTALSLSFFEAIRLAS